MNKIIMHSIDSDTVSDFISSVKFLGYWLDSNRELECRNLIFHTIPVAFEKYLNPFVYKYDFKMFYEVHLKIIRGLLGDDSRLKQKMLGDLDETLFSVKNIYSSALHSPEDVENIFHNDDSKHSYAEACIVKFEALLLSKFISSYCEVNDFNVDVADPRLFIKTKRNQDHLNSSVLLENTLELIKTIPDYMPEKKSLIIPIGHGSCLETGHDTTVDRNYELGLFRAVFKCKEMFIW